MQVDKLEGNKAWIGKVEFEVQPEKRLTSARLRRLMYYALAGKTPVELSAIRDFIDSKMEDGEFFTQGQLAGVVKNMLNNKELVTLERGIYQAGPEFDKKSAAIIDRKPIFVNQQQDSKEESSFAAKREKILKKLENSLEAVRQEVNGVTVSELSDEDFTFIREFRQLDKVIQAFCNRYQDEER